MASLRTITLCAALQLGCAAGGSSTKPAAVSEVQLERAPIPELVAPTPEQPPIDVPMPDAPLIEARQVRPQEISDSPVFVEDFAGGEVSLSAPGGIIAGSGSPPGPGSSSATKPRPRGKLHCEFPEDRKDGVSEGRVVLWVKVDAAGKTVDVKILGQSGGFGQTARRCALTAQFHPGTDAMGAPEVSSVTVVVRFVQP